MLSRDVCPRAVRLDTQIRTPMVSRRRALAHLLIRHREIEMRVGESRVLLDRHHEMLRSRTRVPTLKHHVAEVVVSFGIMILDADRVAIHRLRTSIIAVPKMNVREIHLRDGERRIKPERLLVKRSRIAIGSRVLVELRSSNIKTIGLLHTVHGTKLHNLARRLWPMIEPVEIEGTLAIRSFAKRKIENRTARSNPLDGKLNNVRANERRLFLSPRTETCDPLIHLTLRLTIGFRTERDYVTRPGIFRLFSLTLHDGSLRTSIHATACG